MGFTPLYAALVRALIAHPGWWLPITHYSPRAYVLSGGPFAGVNRAPSLFP